ncbi:MAG: flagellar biosynthesis anti-sigma factor FlgM [Sphingomonas bacterium]|uniref:flagellar biosynthesis anti-sigma factor FlgM n=1 Tax=Sphingomonas bacterium TaxID=1895847 RepID=UPI00263049B7|nr:flagellar biosynthesis anti-sigma factor FlgM [Sphingomonas bacterium]MDB5712064.1 flagellar biosynthesis anti-sigma factor FlgM [Sphingomonas bacterium]
MVDPVSIRGVTGGDFGVAATARVSAAPAPTPVARQPEAANRDVQASGIASELAASAPVDLERVARIRKAISTGNFPILPATIADRMLAFKHDWEPHADQQEQQP